MKYRLDIQGLRGIAVLAVLLFHLDATVLPGGYLGVDIFFVISGFLIANQISNHRRQGSWNLSTYLKRRALRIFPALFLMIFITLFAGFFLLLPIELQRLSQSAGLGVLGLVNFYFYWRTDYFQPNFQFAPLIHTWTISIEEQFYLLLPLLLFLKNIKIRSLTLGLLIVLSFLYCHVSSDQSSAFYLLIGRFWEFGFGIIAALITQRDGQRKANSTISFLSIAVIFASLALVDEEFGTPNYYCLPLVLSTSYLLCTKTSSVWICSFLTLSTLVFMGNISFSLYLWHQPILIYWKIFSFDLLSKNIQVVILFSTLLISVLSFKFVETPFRQYGKYPNLKLKILLLFWLFILGLSFFSHLWRGVPQRLNASTVRYDKAARLVPARRSKCLSGYKQFVTPGDENCRFNSQLPLRAVIWGDSHAEAIAEAVANGFFHMDISMTQITRGRCPPILDVMNFDHDSDCKEFNDLAIKFIHEQEIQYVVIAARWPIYVEGPNKQLKYDDPLPLSHIESPEHTPTLSHVKELMNRTLLRVAINGAKVVLVYPIPEYPWNVPLRLARLAMFHKMDSDLYTISLGEVLQRHLKSEQLLKFSNKSIYNFKPINTFCDREINRCYPMKHGQTLYYDDDHLNFAGSQLLAKDLFSKVNIFK